VEAARRERVSPAQLLRVVRKRLWVIVLAAVLLAGSAAGFVFAQAPTYQASVMILVAQGQPGDAPEEVVDPGGLSGEIEGLQQVTLTMVEAIQTRPIAEGVIGRLGLRMSPDELLHNMDAEQVHSSAFIQVKYEADSPQKAQLIANTIGDVFCERVSELRTSVNPISAKVWERAEAPEGPAGTDPLRAAVVGLVLGTMLGVALAFLLEHFGGGWRSPEEAERISGLPNLGVIPRFELPKGRVPERRKGGDGDVP